MHCASCGFENPEGAKFCIECGGAVKHSCPSCGFDNLPRAKFCADCGTLHHYRREEHKTQERAEAPITLSTEQGFPYFLPAGTILRGWALAEQGQEEEGIAPIRQGLNTLRATGSRVGWSSALVPLAQAYEQVGQDEAGLSVLAEALEVVHQTGERRLEAELVRLKGELALQSHVAEAEECFQQAIEIAHKQQAKSLELRALMSLSRPWRQQDKKEEARKLLAEICNWFTEGFDTKDLQEAKALLEELS